MKEPAQQPNEPDPEAAGSSGASAISRSRIALVGALLVAAVVGAWALRQSDAEPPPTRIAFVGQDLVALKLDRQVREPDRFWKRYEDRDALEGAFMGWMMPGADSLGARVPLRRTLEPGKYYLFVKGINYDRPIKVKFALGGGEATVTTDDSDDNKYWSEPTPVTVESATKELSLRLERSGDSSQKEKLLLRGLYLTTDPHETVLASDQVVRLDYPTSMDKGPPRPGNLVENSSFEAGFGHGWGGTDDRRFSLASVWDPGTGKDGGASLKLPLDPSGTGTGPSGATSATIVSKPYAVAPNKQHTLSLWVKSEAGDPVEGKIALTNSFGPPAAPKLDGERGQHELSRTFRAGEEWTRVDLTGFLLRYPTADYHIKISGDLAAGRHLWVDAISLNEGGPVRYAPRAPLAIGVQRTRPGNLYYEDEPVRMRLRAYNASPRRLDRTVRYEIYDYLNRKVGAGSRKVSVPRATVRTADLDLPRDRRGSFRIVMWVDGDNGSEEEVIYGVVPRPRRPGRDPSSLIGTHSNFTDFQFDAMERLGIKWDRAMSPGSFFRWRDAEPENDKFVWFDAEARRAAQRGISVLGNFGTNDEWPKWAEADGKPDLDKWQEFVGQIVEHYRGDVKTWEIWNEPNSTFEPDFYARMLKRGAEAVKRADPGASVVAMGGPDDPEYIEKVFEELRKQFPGWPWRRYIDTLSMHMYPARVPREAANGGRAAEFRKRILPAYRVPLWNSETGDEDTGLFRTSNAVYERWGRNLFGVADGVRIAGASSTVQTVGRTFLETIGNGLDKIFYYDFRVGGATPTWTKSSYTMLDYDDSVRPKAIAYAALAHLFDHSKGLGTIKLADDDSQAFLFDRGGVPLVGLYAIDGKQRTLSVSGVQSGQIRVFDSMGNRISVEGGRIPYGPRPVYIEGRGLEVSAVKRAFTQATVTQRPDRVGPALTVDQAPRGPVDSPSVRVRWSATDENSVPSHADPEAITYSYRLRGAPGNAWSAWSERTVADFANLPGGRYHFDVRARDAAGNRSAVVSRSIVVR
ncbi:MAG: hypothetical protein M3417_14590 [Actinomycetota bacterium]|nr:hypothetical protein [Actinomycetota bacterium]